MILILTFSESSLGFVFLLTSFWHRQCRNYLTVYIYIHIFDWDSEQPQQGMELKEKEAQED